MRGGGGSGWRDCWTGICASTPPGRLYRLCDQRPGETFSVPSPRYTTPDGGASPSLRSERRSFHDPSAHPLSALRSIFWGTLLLFLDFDLNFRFGFSFTLPLLPNCIGFWLVARGTRSLAADRPSLGLLAPSGWPWGSWSLQQFSPASPSYPRRALPSGRSGPDVRRLSAVHRSGRSGGGPAPRRALPGSCAPPGPRLSC